MRAETDFSGSKMLTRTDNASLPNERANEAYSGASKDAISYHYDNGVEFYKLWIGEDLYYTAAKYTDTLTDTIVHEDYRAAQDAKTKFHLDAIGATESRSLLDIGCGWGTSLNYAAQNDRYSKAVGITLSEEQGDYIRSRGLPNLDVFVESYEYYEPDQKFDGILTLGALEHFARPGMTREQKVDTYRKYFSKCSDWLERGGFLSLQCSTWNGVSREMAGRIVPSDVFPESDLAYENEIFEAAEPFFELHHYERSMTDYIKTIAYWHQRLRRNKDAIIDLIGEEQYDFHDRYMRRVSAGFRRRRIQLSRFVFRVR